MDPSELVDAVLDAWASPCRSWTLGRFSLGWVERVLGMETLPCLFGAGGRIRVTVCHGEPPPWCGGGFCVCSGGDPYEERRLCPVRCIETPYGYVLVEEV